jgi:flavin-dependent dehydrogenase
MADYEVAVVGGGPAGVAAALTLAAAGARTCLIDRGEGSRAPRYGEVLPPEIAKTYARLGLAGLEHHRPSAGVLCAWGGPELAERAHIANVHGHAWAVDRAHLDAAARHFACTRGVALITASVERVQGSGRRLALTFHDRRRSYLTAERIVLATGRAGRLMVGAMSRLDALVALIATQPAGVGDPDDHRCLVAGAPHGWWFSTTCPDRSRIVMLLTDADLLPRTRGGRETFWQTQWDAIPALDTMLAPVRQAETMRWARPAATEILWPTSGRGWVLAGEAWLRLDPLSGQGVKVAMDDGIAAALYALGPCDDTAAAALEGQRQRAAAQMMVTRCAVYAAERRWEKNAFWLRRNGRVIPWQNRTKHRALGLSGA